MTKAFLHNRKFIHGIAVGVIVTAFLIVVGVVWYLIKGIIGPPAIITENIEDYNTIFTNNVYSELMVFPDKIPASATETEFYYYWKDTFLDPTSQIYVSCKYNKEDFEAEKKRISNIKITTELNMVKIREDNGKYFKHPTYIAILNNNCCFEYAIVIEEESRIVYVFTMFVRNSEIKFPKEYLPDMNRQNYREDQFYLYAISTDSIEAHINYS